MADGPDVLSPTHLCVGRHERARAASEKEENPMKRTSPVLTSLQLLAASSLLAATSAAVPAPQGTWTELTPTTSPPPSAGHDVVSDGSRALCFGGKEGGAGLQNKIWAFDGTDWTDISPTSGPTPPARKTGGVAWDSGRGRLVVFGGDQGGPSDDTWEWDGSTWTQMSPASSLPAMKQCDMVYVPGLATTYLFGGSDGTTLYDETWAWDGVNWTQLSPATVPPARRQHFMACDTSSSTVFMYGGFSTASTTWTNHKDTWVFDGTNWTEIVTANFPTGGGGTYGLNNGAMSYDPLRDVMVLFGGVENGPTLPSTWEFDGADWTNLGISGAGDRSATSMRFVAGLGKIILFGGYRTTQMDDTWEYVGPSTGPGTAYCFGRTDQGNPCPCGNDNDGSDPLGAGCAHDDANAGARLYGTGVASVGADSLVLVGLRGPVSNSSMFFQANNNQDGAGLFLGDAIRCAGGGLIRLKVKTTTATGDADSSPMSISARSASFGHTILAGETLYYQWWFRDSNGSPCGTESNTSNGYMITWLP